MNGKNETPQGFTPQEFKPFPCECGACNWSVVPYYTRQVHRFRSDIVLWHKRDRLTCSGCGKVVEP